MTTPLSDERLAEIRTSLEQLRAQVQTALTPSSSSIVDVREPETADVSVPISTIFMGMNALELLREVERLLDERTALLKTRADLHQVANAFYAILMSLDTTNNPETVKAINDAMDLYHQAMQPDQVG